MINPIKNLINGLDHRTRKAIGLIIVSIVISTILILFLRNPNNLTLQILTGALIVGCILAPFFFLTFYKRTGSACISAGIISLISPDFTIKNLDSSLVSVHTFIVQNHITLTWIFFVVAVICFLIDVFILLYVEKTNNSVYTGPKFRKINQFLNQDLMKENVVPRSDYNSVIQSGQEKYDEIQLILELDDTEKALVSVSDIIEIKDKYLKKGIYAVFNEPGEPEVVSLTCDNLDEVVEKYIRVYKKWKLFSFELIRIIEEKTVKVIVVDPNNFCEGLTDHDILILEVIDDSLTKQGDEVKLRMNQKIKSAGIHSTKIELILKKLKKNGYLDFDGLYYTLTIKAKNKLHPNK